MKNIVKLALISLSACLISCRKSTPIIPSGNYREDSHKDTIIVMNEKIYFDLAGAERRTYSYELNAKNELIFVMPSNDYNRGVTSFRWSWSPPHLIRTDKSGNTVEYVITP